jgi:hypothetical protein
MSVKCIYFSSVINLTIPDFVSCCVFSDAAGCISIQNLKNKVTLYFTFYPKEQVWVAPGIIATTTCRAWYHFSFSSLNIVSNLK